VTTQNQETRFIRTFIALPLNENLRQSLSTLQSELKTVSTGVSWVAQQNIHLTLLFLGDISEDMVIPLSKTLDMVGNNNAPCAIDVNGIGFFGKALSPRVIWAGLHGELQHITVIQKQIAAAVQAVGCQYDKKPFKPHLTIGRVRSARHAKDLVAAIDSRKNIPLGTLDIQCILLMKSDLTPQGPVYSVLHKSSLEKG